MASCGAHEQTVMDNDWSADIDAEVSPSGSYVAVLGLVPPAEVGPPIRRVLPGEYPTAEHRRHGQRVAVVEMACRRSA